MRNRVVALAVLLAAMAQFGLVGTPASAAPLTFKFVFDVPDFSKPELDPLEQLFMSNGVTEVTGMVSYDSDDADFVTSNFLLTSNIDPLFDQSPDELVFAPTGNLNQIRSWEVHIAGVRYILELTGLDETDTLPNRWFGGQILGFPNNTFDLTSAGGGLTQIPEPSTLTLLLGGLAGLAAVRLRRRS